MVAAEARGAVPRPGTGRGRHAPRRPRTGRGVPRGAPRRALQAASDGARSPGVGESVPGQSSRRPAGGHPRRRARCRVRPQPPVRRPVALGGGRRPDRAAPGRRGPRGRRGAGPRHRGGGWVLLIRRGGALAQVNPCAGRPRLRGRPAGDLDMMTISVADVDVKYRTVEVPEVCPMCGNRLQTNGRLRRAAVRELNLASANFFGTFGRDGEDGFLVDTEAGEEHPSDAVWIVFGYECADCGEVLASGSVGVG